VDLGRKREKVPSKEVIFANSSEKVQRGLGRKGGLTGTQKKKHKRRVQQGLKKKTINLSLGYRGDAGGDKCRVKGPRS